MLSYNNIFKFTQIKYRKNITKYLMTHIIVEITKKLFFKNN